MKTLLVGFGFRARHGKDTVAREVARLLPEARVMPLALHLKAVARFLGMREKDPVLLQALGTDVARKMHRDVWIECLESWIEEDQPEVALIPDVRFRNEAQWIAQEGGLLYRVDRVANELGHPYVALDRSADHVSERELEGWRFNRSFSARSGDLEALRRAAITVAYDVRDRLNHRFLDTRRAEATTRVLNGPVTLGHPDYLGASDPCGRPECEQVRIDALAAARRDLG